MSDEGDLRESDDAAVVRTFLIADVRGYTRFTQQHGDEAGGAVAAKFAALARDTIRASGGEVVELRGDEALCAFPSSRRALAAAVELQRRFRERVDGEPVFPLGIGIGIDAGEAVPVEDGYRGGPLNVAARLCGIAAPGQILASDTVASLARRLEGVRFVERRAARLKGLEKPVRVIEVVPETPLPPLPDVPAPRKRGRLALVLAAAALVAACALTAGLLLLTGGSDGPESVGNAIAAVDAGGDVSYTEAGTTPSTIAVGEGAVWVLNADDRTISKVDPETRQIVKTFGTSGTTTDLAVGEGAVWIGNGSAPAGETFESVYTSSVARLDPTSADVTTAVALPDARSTTSEGSPPRLLGVSQIAVGAGAVWAINPDGTVSRIDPDTGDTKTIDVHAGSTIAVGEGGVWVLGGEGAEVIRIGPRSKAVVDRIEVPSGSLAGLAVGGGSVWASDLFKGVLWRIDPGPPADVRPIDVGFGVTSVAFGAGAAWATNFVADELVRVDAETSKVTARIPIAGTPPSVAISNRTAWVSVAGARSGRVLPSSICGPVLSGGRNPDVLISSDLPLQGPTGRIERVAAAGVEHVLRTHRFQAGRYTVGYQSCDDSTAQAGLSDILKCASNAKTYAATPRLVGVIGPFHSVCAWAEVPIANRADGSLAMISPASTHQGLTHRAPGMDRDEPGRYYPTGVRNYARVTGPFDWDAAAGAVLAHELGLRRVYVLRSGQGLGEEATTPFKRAARRLGFTIAGSAIWDASASGYDAIARQVAAARPDGVFIGDELSANGAAVVKALRTRVGPKVALIAGDAFQPTSLVLAEAGEAAIGMYVTTPAVAHEGLGAGGKRFVREFGKTQPGGRVPSAVYVTETAEAAEVLLAAIARSDGTRESVTRELHRVEIKNGILGSFRFDANGDITPAAFTVFRITGSGNRDPDLPDVFSGAVVDRVVRVPHRLVGG